MLTYLLVWIVALGSLGIYLTAFFFPELHRKNDLIWSGVGLFYALVLWVYSDRIRGGFLLGQTAGVALLVWLGWQTWQLRRELTPADLKTPIPADLKDKLTGLVATVQSKLGGTSQPTPAKVDVSRLKTQATGLLDTAKAKLQDLGILAKPSGTPKVSTPPAVTETIATVETIVAEVGEDAAVIEVVEVIETVIEEAVAEAPDPEVVEPLAVVEEVPEAPPVSAPEMTEPPLVEIDSVDATEPPTPEPLAAEAAAIADNSLVEPSEPQTLEPRVEAVPEPEPVAELEPEAPPENLTTNQPTVANPEELTSLSHELMQSTEEAVETTETAADHKSEGENWPPPEPTP
ncbi:MAG: hypothetical protein KME35_14695 [Aphanocapsa sp. GSE-SYN-MK-11-07L]|nr:hypothetical protein [Aphanocapsa sp. GSE-SYN-MK-11-07L]